MYKNLDKTMKRIAIVFPKRMFRNYQDLVSNSLKKFLEHLYSLIQNDPYTQYRGALRISHQQLDFSLARFPDCDSFERKFIIDQG